MKKPLQLITLNIWGGQLLNPLLHFIKDHSHVDIFCLQEVYSTTHQHLTNDFQDDACLDIFERIADILPNHQAIFQPIIEGVYGLSMFIHQDHQILKEGRHWIYENKHYAGHGPSHSRILQWATINLENQALSIINIHGLWNGQGKTDSPERILQSHIINDFAQTRNTPTILCGDFNLMPDTQSMDILAANRQHLVKQYAIQSTRSAIYTKRERFADYILMPEDLKVLDFKVFNQEISDHLPLYVEFSI